MPSREVADVPDDQVSVFEYVKFGRKWNQTLPFSFLSSTLELKLLPNPRDVLSVSDRMSPSVCQVVREERFAPRVSLYL